MSEAWLKKVTAGHQTPEGGTWGWDGIVVSLRLRKEGIGVGDTVNVIS